MSLFTHPIILTTQSSDECTFGQTARYPDSAKPICLMPHLFHLFTWDMAYDLAIIFYVTVPFA